MAESKTLTACWMHDVIRISEPMTIGKPMAVDFQRPPWRIAGSSMPVPIMSWAASTRVLWPDRPSTKRQITALEERVSKSVTTLAINPTVNFNADVHDRHRELLWV